MTKLEFTPRNELAAYEWDAEKKHWNRPELDREILKKLSERSTLNGLLRVGLFVFLLVGSAAAAIYTSRFSLLLAIPLFYLYFFLYGFWVAIAHELQHKTVFAQSFNKFSECLFFIVQTLIWNSPRYARISHRLHHRYTMVRGMDPETNWPDPITTKWLRKLLFSQISRILVIGAVRQFYYEVLLQVRRIAGHKDWMMRDHCSDRDILVIRWESAGILAFHVAIIALAIWFHRWEPIAFITLAWQIGSPIEQLWHNTEHIGRVYDGNDQRLVTRSVKVNPFIKSIYWGLDDHVDHHIFPAVPSRNLPKLHKILGKDLSEPKTMVQCWREMFAIAKEKDTRPEHEYVPMVM